MSDESAIRNALNGHTEKRGEGDNAALKNALTGVYYNALDKIYALPYPDTTPSAPTQPQTPAPTATQTPAVQQVVYPQPTTTTPQPTPQAGGNWFSNIVDTFSKNIAGGQQMLENLPLPTGAPQNEYLPKPVADVGGALFGIGQTAAQGGYEALTNLPVVGEGIGQLGGAINQGFQWYGENINTPVAGLGSAITEPFDRIGATLSGIQDTGAGLRQALQGNPQPLQQAFQDIGNAWAQPLKNPFEFPVGNEPVFNLAVEDFQRGNYAKAASDVLVALREVGNQEYSTLSPEEQLAASFVFDPLNFIPGLGIGKLQKGTKLAELTRDVGRIEKAADLLPKGLFGKIGTPVAKVTETVKSGLQNVLLRTTFTHNADEMFAGLRAFEAAGKDAKGFDEITKVYAGLKSVPAQRGARLIQEFGPVIDDIERGYRALENGVDAVTDLKKLPKSFARFAEDVKAGRASVDDLLEFTQAEVATRLQEHMAGQAAKLFPAKTGGAVRGLAGVANRFLNELKGAEALVYIGLSPVTFVKNIVNGVTTMRIEGVNPLMSVPREIQKLRKLGKLEMADDLQRAVNLQKTMIGTGGAVRQAFGEGGFATGATGAFGSFMSKMIQGTPIGAPLRWYEGAERAMRAKVWTNTYYKAMLHNWDAGAWIPKIDAATEAVLHQYRVDPNDLLNIVREAGADKGKILKNLNDFMDGKRGAAVNWDAVAQEMGLSKKELLSFLDEHDAAKASQMAEEFAARRAAGVPQAQAANDVVAQAARETADATAAKTGYKVSLGRDSQIARMEEQRGALMQQWNDLTRGGSRASKQGDALLDQIDELEKGIEEQRTILAAERSAVQGTPPPDVTPPEAPAAPVEPKPPEPPPGAPPVAEAAPVQTDVPSAQTDIRAVETPPSSPAFTVDTVRARAAQLTQPTLKPDLMREWNALRHEGEAENIQRATQKAVNNMSPDVYLEKAQKWIAEGRAKGQTWMDTMADMFEDRAHFILDQVKQGNPKYATPEMMDRLANGDALTKLLRGGDNGFDWTKFDQPFENRGYESFAQYRQRTTNAAIARDFPESAGAGTGSASVGAEGAGAGRGAATGVETGAGGGAGDVGRVTTEIPEGQVFNEKALIGEMVKQDDAMREIERLRNIAKEDPEAVRILSRDEIVKSKARTQADMYEALLNLWSREDVRYVRLGSDAKNRVMSWMRRDVFSAADDAHMGATVAADWMDNAVMISRDGETVFDAALSVLSPFQFWRTRFALETLRRVADKPGRLAWYMNLRNAQDQIKNDPRYPKRLQGRMFIPVPWVPQWAGGGMWFDPLEQATAVKQVFELDQFQDEVTDAEVASSIRALASRGELSTTEAANAIANQSGALWDATKQRLMELAKSNKGGEALSDMFRPHLPLDIIWKLKTGTADEIGVLFPMTRLIRGATSALAPQGSFLNPTGQGINIEQPLKAGLRAITGDQSIPDWDMWEEYRTDRALADMVGEGLLTERDAMIAMIERRGTFFDRARLRAQEQMRDQNYSFFGGQIFPEGEKQYYKSKVLLNQLLDQSVATLGANPLDFSNGEKWDLVKANGLTKRGTPLGDFYQQHPEYTTRQSVYDEPEARLKGFLIDELWNKYYSIGKLDQRLMGDDLGETFQKLFRNKDTRDLSSVTLDQLGEWVRKARAYVPEQQIVKVGDFPPVRYATPDQNARYAAMQAQRDQWFNMDDLSPKLDTYHKMSREDGMDYRARNPDLDGYLKWYGAQMKANPDIAALLSDKNQQKSYELDSRYAQNAVTRGAVANLNRMVNRIGDTYARRYNPRGGGSRGGGAAMSAKVKQALAAKKANPRYYIPRDVYAELLRLFRDSGANMPFAQWLQLMVQRGGI